MRSTLTLLGLTILALLWAAPAEADPMDQARQAYQAGDWQEAARLAGEAGGAEGYAWAAGSLVAQLMLEADYPDRETLAEQAVEHGEMALRLDPDSIEARWRLAGALGFQGRYMSGWRAYLRGVPQRGRDLLQDTLNAEPDNAWAWGMWGAWNLEVARRGGRRGMRALDASIEEGLAAYETAIALDPDNPSPHYFKAVGLIAIDTDYAADARSALDAALALQPRDAFEAGILDEARRLSALMDRPRQAQRWANQRMQI
ncbi:hypothetical protein RMQ97_11650 [Maricaulis sp. D1M11]|uniref:hypothetical protein n=1 Tax=Maricaulis sp. D1M11 TaxID=3076117 RepID=UPI0039B378CB